MNTTRKVLASILVLVFALALLPTAALAEGESSNTAAIRLGASGVSGPTAVAVDGSGTYYAPASYIYYRQSDGATPIKWRMLDADGNNNGENSGMFLLSEVLLANSVYFNNTAPYSNGSNINADGQATIDPRGQVTRAEAAAMLHRFIEAISPQNTHPGSSEPGWV